MERTSRNRVEGGHAPEREPAIDPEALAGLRDLQEEGEPDLLRELVDLFLADAEPRLASLRAAVHRADAPAVEREAHALKGSCANFGARPMSGVCGQLQDAGRSGELANAPDLLVGLEAEYERVRTALRAALSGS